jgi:hypothetical protein
VPPLLSFGASGKLNPVSGVLVTFILEKDIESSLITALNVPVNIAEVGTQVSGGQKPGVTVTLPI